MLSQRAAKDVVREFEENLTWSQRLADKVAELNGSWAFILMLMGLTVLWCIGNVPSIAAQIGLYTRAADGAITGFDPYPYILYNLVLAVLVSLQGPLIVMSQNRQSLKDRAKADTDFRVNLKNEIGIEKMLAEVGAMRAELNKRLEVLERSARADRVRAEVPAKTPGGPFSAA
jgi:CRP/FNR family cyclic AMP-dependent transcriptional regulator